MNGKRTASLNIRLTEEELEFIRKMSEKSGKTITKFLLDNTFNSVSNSRMVAENTESIYSNFLNNKMPVENKDDGCNCTVCQQLRKWFKN